MSVYRLVWVVNGVRLVDPATHDTMTAAICHGLKTCYLCSLNPSAFTAEAVKASRFEKSKAR